MSFAATLASAPPPRARAVLLVLGCDLGIWLLAAFFATSEFYRRSVLMGGPALWPEVLDVQICTALIWAAFTPPVVLLAQRLLLRPPHLVRHAVNVIVLIPVLAVYRAAFGGVVLNLAEHDPISRYMINRSVGIRTHRDIAILAAIFFVTNLVDAHRESAQRERQRAHAQTLLARTAIDDLRMRLQPKFALRMLRHIASVLRDDPAAADALIVTLSGILRRSMARDGDERIRLGDELEHLDRCLELCRAGGRFPVASRYVATDEVLACRVPELVLQPVIEAVVLDLTSSSSGGSVEVHCQLEQGDARIDIRSTAASGNAIEAHEQSAVAVRARLATLYGGGASVHVAASGEAVLTTLRIPCEEEALVDPDPDR
jgi:hypothetical protein